jgi:hypothetical protein
MTTASAAQLAALLFDYEEAMTPSDVARGIATEPRAPAHDSGPRALMCAVLQDAILCLQGSGPGVAARERERLARDAVHWMGSRDRTWIFSFESICHVLGFDPDALRRRVRQLLREGKRVDLSDPGMHDTLTTQRRALRLYRMRGNNSLRRVQAPRIRRRRPTTATVHPLRTRARSFRRAGE